MDKDVPRGRAHVTLFLLAILHALTHAYGQALVPLYLLIKADLHLGGVRAASLIVTIYGFVYCISSYGGGILADRFNRKALLAVGLFGNALVLIAMGLVRQYEMLMVLAILGGLFGTLFHPAANALAPAHYPRSPGMAIGLLGMGSGLGFFFGPQYSGWRAQSATWHWGMIADWQRPCVELGLIGLAVGVVFLLFASETKRELRTHPAEEGTLPNRIAIEAIVTNIRTPHSQRHLSSHLRNLVIVIAAILSLRDFVGLASVSLLSIYLQKAYDYSPQKTGLIVGSMMLLSIAMNPISIYLSAGRRRLPGLALVLVLGGVTILTIPLLPIGWVLPVMCIFESFQFSSYAMSDAAMLERVSPMVRGRVVGVFITLSGTFASLAPWAMGWWTDLLRDRAREPISYLPIFGTLAVMMCLSALGTPMIAKLKSARGQQSRVPIATQTTESS